MWNLIVLYLGILCISVHVTSAQDATYECYHCDATVRDYHECKTTMMCDVGQVCMIKQLNSLVDGHHEYQMTCARKEDCNGGRKRGLESRDISVTCCLKDLCNYPEESVAAATTTAEPGCKKDLIFILDESESLKGNQSKVREFIKGVVTGIGHINNDNTLVSIGTFASTAVTRFELGEHQNLTSLKHAINQVHFNGGDADNNVAIDFLIKQLTTNPVGNRPDVDDAVVLITNNVNHNDVQNKLLASQLHQISTDVITVGIGPQVHQTELDQIATDYGHSFWVHNPVNMARIEARVVNLICTGQRNDIIVGK